jgi:hypothetical protein
MLERFVTVHGSLHNINKHKGNMKKIFAMLVLATASLAVSAQQPVSTPKPAETVAPAGDKAASPAVTPEAAAVKKEPVSKIDEAISPCDLTMQYSPIVSGLQLRMSEGEAEVKAHTKFEADPAGPTGRKTLNVKLNKDPILENLDSASLKSNNGKVNFIRLTYPQKYPTIKEYISDFAPKLGVSRIAFRVDREKNEAFMTCKDFTIELKTGSMGSELTLIEKGGN